MKLIARFILGMGVMAMAATSCSHDDPVFEYPSGTVVEEDGQTFSIFSLACRPESPLIIDMSY